MKGALLEHNIVYFVRENFREFCRSIAVQENIIRERNY